MTRRRSGKAKWPHGGEAARPILPDTDRFGPAGMLRAGLAIAYLVDQDSADTPARVKAEGAKKKNSAPWPQHVGCMLPQGH